MSSSSLNGPTTALNSMISSAQPTIPFALQLGCKLKAGGRPLCLDDALMFIVRLQRVGDSELVTRCSCRAAVLVNGQFASNFAQNSIASPAAAAATLKFRLEISRAFRIVNRFGARPKREARLRCVALLKEKSNCNTRSQVCQFAATLFDATIQL